MSAGEREQAERALDGYQSDSDDPESIAWPPAARRIAEARARAGLSESEMAERLGMTFESYDDLERYNDEVFMVIGLNTLRELARALNVTPGFIVIGDESRGVAGEVGFAEISRRLTEHLAKTGTTAEAFGHAIGWYVEPIIADPQALAEWNVDGLYALTKELGLDWVAALASGE